MGSVEHGREPCPHRILDDLGGAFGMGAVGGGVWHFGKGMYNAPKGVHNRLTGGLTVRLLPTPRRRGAARAAAWDRAAVRLRGR